MRRIIVVLIAALLSGALSITSSAQTSYSKIGVEIDGVKLNVEAFNVDGRTMVPLRAIFEKLHAEVLWEPKTKSITAKKGSVTVKLGVNDTAAYVNNNAITLDVPPMLINSYTYVPLRFVSESLGAEVGYDAKRMVASILTTDSENSTSSGNSTANPDTDPKPDTTPKPNTKPAPTSAAEPFVVKGYVKDRLGNPMKGIEISADNQFAWNNHLVDKSDENGYYEISLPEAKTAYSMFSYYEHEFEGKVLPFNLTPDTEDTFGGHVGAIRNFTWDDLNAKVTITLWNFPGGAEVWPEDLPEFSEEDVELTLTPLTPLIDGSTGQEITEMSKYSPRGTGVDVPIAKYRITARWMPGGIDPIPLLITSYAQNQYAEFVESADYTVDSGTIKLLNLKIAFPETDQEL